MVTERDILESLRTVVDPELGVNIVDLGLVYRVKIAGSRLAIVMTMTSPACPLRDYIKALVVEAVGKWTDELEEIEISIVTDPPWSADLMSDAARRQLGGNGQ
jgi:metal-sulfur cluster biosynthetic enzyme